MEPAHLLLTFRPRLPLDLVCGSPESKEEERKTQTLYVDKVREHLQDSFLRARRNTEKAKQRQAKQCDARGTYGQYSVSDRVWLHNPAVPVGRSAKFFHPWRGPYQIIEKLGPVTFRIQREHQKETQVVHHNRLKHCHAPPSHSCSPKLQERFRHSKQQGSSVPSKDKLAPEMHHVLHEFHEVLRRDHSHSVTTCPLSSATEEGTSRTPVSQELTYAEVVQGSSTAALPMVIEFKTARPQRLRRHPDRFGDGVFN